MTEFQKSHFRKQLRILNIIIIFTVFFSITGPLDNFGIIGTFFFILTTGFYMVINILKDGNKNLSNITEIRLLFNKTRVSFIGYSIAVVIFPIIRGFSVSFLLTSVVTISGMILIAIYSFILTNKSGNYQIEKNKTDLFDNPKSLIVYFVLIILLGGTSIVLLGFLLFEPIIFSNNQSIRYLIIILYVIVEFVILIFMFNKTNKL